jgi:choline dehydrogenase-like flavoprotein
VSLFPDAIGCNPGLTVMCLAERAADEFLAQDRRAHA